RLGARRPPTPPPFPYATLFRSRPMLLVVDEAHERPDTEAQDRRMREIIDRRYKSERDTLLITNMKPEALGESIGGAAIDRIRQCGGMIPCNWGSFRHSKGGATK